MERKKERKRERKKARQTKFLSFFSLLAFVRSSFFGLFCSSSLTFSKKGKRKKRRRRSRLPLFSKSHFFKERERKGQPLFLSFFLFFGLSFCSFPSHFFSPSSLKSSSFLASFLRRRGVAAVRLRRRRRGGNTFPPLRFIAVRSFERRGGIFSREKSEQGKRN